MLPAHIVMWLEERHIGTPDGDPVYALQDGLLFLRALHCHLEHPPEFPSDRLERWKMIVSVLLDGGIEVTDTGLRMALFGDRKTLMTLLQAIYCLYHPSEGLNLPIHLDPEPQVHYPPLVSSLIEGSKSYDELVERIRLCLQIESPERSAQEIGGQLLEELASRLDRVVAFERYEDFLQLVVGQMKSTIHSVSMRACGILQKLIGMMGKEQMLQQLIGARSAKLATVQDNLVSMLFAEGSSPELVDFIHGTLVELSCPSQFRAMVEGLMLPRLASGDALHELSKFIEYSEVLQCADVGWLVQLVSERLQEAVQSDAPERMDEMEAAVVLFLRLWTEAPDTVEASGETDRVRSILVSPDGVQLCCRQVVLSELTSVVFVCPDIYDVLLHALQSVMKMTQLRRPLLRSLVRLHTTNTALSVVPLIELTATELYKCHCAIAEGDFVSSMGKHPQLSMVFGETTATWLELLHKLIEAEPFMHTFACGAITQLTGNMPDDADLVSAVGFLVEDLLSTSEDHAHSTLLLHCVSKLHKSSPPAPAEHIHRTVFMFVQRLIRRLDEERLQAEAEERQRQMEIEAAAREEAAAQDAEEQRRLQENPQLASATSSQRPATTTADQQPPAAEGSQPPGSAASSAKQKETDVARASPTNEGTNDAPPPPASPSGAHEPAPATEQPAERGPTSPTPTSTENHQPNNTNSGNETAPAAAATPPPPAAAPQAEAEQMSPEDKEAMEERKKRRELWLSALRQLCSELFIQFKKVPVVELDPPPPTPKAKTPAASANGADDELRPLDDGERDALNEDFAHADDVFNMTSPSDQEGGLAHAQTFTTESSEPRRVPVNVKVQSKETLAKLNERKMCKYMDATYIQPMMKRVFDIVARREFKRMINERGRISPDHKINASAKIAHDKRREAERLAREKEAKDRIARRDEEREKRDRRIKNALSQKQQQAEIDKTPASPKYYTDNLINTRKSETEERKQIIAEEFKTFIELYRECRDQFKQVEAIDQRNERARQRQETLQEAQKRELLRSKLNDYFDVKRQQEELQKRNEWERQMQEEFDRRLRFAKRSDNLKRKLLNWKMDQQDKERSLSESRARHAHSSETPTAAGGGGAGKPPSGRRLPPLSNTPEPTPTSSAHRPPKPAAATPVPRTSSAHSADGGNASRRSTADPEGGGRAQEQSPPAGAATNPPTPALNSLNNTDNGAGDTAPPVGSAAGSQNPSQRASRVQTPLAAEDASAARPAGSRPPSNPAPTADPAPIAGSRPPSNPAPTADPAPIAGSRPPSNPAPTADPAPIAGSRPPSNPAPTADPAPIAGSRPPSNPAPTADAAPIAGSRPPSNPAPTADPVPPSATKPDEL